MSLVLAALLTAAVTGAVASDRTTRNPGIEVTETEIDGQTDHDEDDDRSRGLRDADGPGDGVDETSGGQPLETEEGRAKLRKAP